MVSSSGTIEPQTKAPWSPGSCLDPPWRHCNEASNNNNEVTPDSSPHAAQALPPPPPAPPSLKDNYLKNLFQSCSIAAVPPLPPPVVITGVAAGLPGRDRPVFREDNLAALIRGESFITRLQEATVADLIDKNVVQLVKNKDGSTERLPVDNEEKSIKLAAQLGSFDLTDYGVSPAMVSTMDMVVQVGIAAGLEALKDAGIVRGGKTIEDWQLPESMRDSTGVVYTTSFPALEAAVSEVMRFLHSRQKSMAQSRQLLAALRSQLVTACGTWDDVSQADKEAFERLEAALMAISTDENHAPYEYDRKFLFRVLVLGNAQLAQIVGARGPNMQTNAACAGTTQAIAIAQDILQQGRCERLVVIASDNAAGDVLIPWLGSGFRALGAATLHGDVANAALPFDKRRTGMILGAGAIGIVLETEASVARRYAEKLGLLSGPTPLSPSPEDMKVLGEALKIRVLETQYSNSAYHGASLDKNHIALELDRFLNTVERRYGITREEIAKDGVYLSHETMTHASPSASCSANEIYALRQCFKEHLEHLVLLNTKGFTGHPMGVSFEDAVAVEILRRGEIPPIANYQESTVDPYLGKIRLVGEGGKYQAKWALRFAAGFGSQVVFALYGLAKTTASEGGPVSYYYQGLQEQQSQSYVHGLGRPY